MKELAFIGLFLLSFGTGYSQAKQYEKVVYKYTTIVLQNKYNLVKADVSVYYYDDKIVLKFENETKTLKIISHNIENSSITGTVMDDNYVAFEFIINERMLYLRNSLGSYLIYTL